MRLWAASIALLWCAAPDAAAAAAEASAPELVARAEKAREAGKLEESLALIERAYALDPRPELLNNAGKLLEELGRYADACDAYQRVLETKRLDPKLRALDETRLAALRSKLDNAHLVFDAPSDAVLWLSDGSRIAPQKESAVAPLKTLVMIAGARAETVLLFPVELARGRRTTVRVPSGFGRLELVPAGAKVLIVDETRWVLPPGIARVELSEGRHVVEVRWEGVPQPSRWSGRLELGVSETLERERVDTPRAIALVPPPKVEESAPAIWPYVSIGAGVVAVAVAIGFRQSAQADVDAVAQRTHDGMVDLTQDEVAEYNRSVSRKSAWFAGLAITGGLALLAGGAGLVF